MKAWTAFNKGGWQSEISVRDFIVSNYEEYTGDESFLASKTEKTQTLWDKCEVLIKEEIEKGIIDIETAVFSGVDAFEAGYIDKESEVIVGLQTDAPLKRIVNPYGGFRMVEASLDAYGYSLDETMKQHFTSFRKTHNEGVFDAYTPKMKQARSVGLLTGLPDAYGRGRIIGDYRRVALYGVDFLIKNKQDDLAHLLNRAMDEKTIRLREEVNEQIRALIALKNMARTYGFDLSKPAESAKDAVQYFYFAYLAAIKENNGAAMSLGRNTTFLDIYIERDIKSGVLTEEGAQELIDQLVIKLRLVRHLRTPDYNTLFAGDPTWVTEAIGGMNDNGKSLVTKTAYRFLHTLTNLGAAPEPNMTVLWSENLPEAFKRYCMKMTTQTGAIQYENDDLMRPLYTDDYGIACCVSAMTIGKQMQYFGARTNMGKALLYALNEGHDELKTTRDGEPVKIVDGVKALKSDVLNYDEVMSRFKYVIDDVAGLYVDTMNIIHYMHDKYAYEAVQMGLHDTTVHRLMAYGMAGISLVADSLSAIKHAKVTAIRNEKGITTSFSIDGEYPQYGNDDDRVDELAIEVVEYFMDALKKHVPYRDSEQTMSLLTITSNVVYGKKTGATPDGRLAGEPFAPGANPMHGRDNMGALASLNTVAKLPYEASCRDGISNTFSIVPEALGKEDETRFMNLAGILDGYFSQGAFHLNVNVLSKELLIDAMHHPEKYPTLTIRVSGYAVHFNRLTKEQKMEVINRTCHTAC
ncbi:MULTISPECIES: formate C-acetyltransferase [unclassified Fusibacter]|uniref:formate C-acetyltransferase n=1 Tax=unclassified Fusibacter TaxID=2624464 RepID=UPI001011401A|nr:MULTISPECIES: formate C-acetyltransferase [unclassified Fusibacter]MCK8061103.1 formate C-acetyltransferase [Fusibacter sp. A2]NPE23361.1 formate C-acetyltransferase [Fusibacter sp. A1]RXV59406.1 formate C-acetyltransferase [Fusibacter sp. A1]